MNIKQVLLVIGLSATLAAPLSAGYFDAAQAKAGEALAAAQKLAGYTIKEIAVYRDVTFVYLEKNKYNVSAFVLTTVAGVAVTYVLYENGTLLELADYTARHPYRVASSVIAAAGLAGLAVFAYQNNFDVAVMKDKAATFVNALGKTCTSWVTKAPQVPAVAVDAVVI